MRTRLENGSLTPDYLKDLYGDSKLATKTAANGTAPGTHSSRTRSVIHISLCDSLPAYGPIADMTFSLSKLGVRVMLLSRPAVRIYSRLRFGSSCCLGTCYLFDGRSLSMSIGTIRSRTGSCHRERSSRGFYSFPGTQRLLIPPVCFLTNHSRYPA